MPESSFNYLYKQALALLQAGREDAALTAFRALPTAYPDQEPGPLRWAAVEAGKWGRARPGRRSYCDAFELVDQDGVGDHRQELSIVAVSTRSDS